VTKPKQTLGTLNKRCGIGDLVSVIRYGIGTNDISHTQIFFVHVLETLSNILYKERPDLINTSPLTNPALHTFSCMNPSFGQLPGCLTTKPPNLKHHAHPTGLIPRSREVPRPKRNVTTRGMISMQIQRKAQG
jgi:hypothetical protein